MENSFYNWLVKTKTKITKPEKYTNTIITISNHFKKILNKEIKNVKI